MSGPWSEPETPGRPVERRLRAALAARADTITVTDLRPAEPPGPAQRRAPLARLRLRRFALPLAGLATAAAVAIGYVAVTSGPVERHPLPANSPGPVKPPPTAAPSGTPGPAPSPVPSDPPSVTPWPRPGGTPPAAPSKAPATPRMSQPSRGAVPQRSASPPRPTAR
ncbi:hypothetical protein [Streptomyces sp. NBC_00083]|uniref:hypothetical protein n=1 Tax=Streptomyces sp. NBC_00083 TaxID=2975647 RepID=UPI00225910D2|nr:hypothetical protein [Streptomyces sp. NBC_00083]MCX5384032.1 hypothetical protein [Streptomyces sp. NBC_00083]